MAEQYRGLAEKSPTFRLLKKTTGLRTETRRVHAFLLAKICMEIGNVWAATSMARIAAKEFILNKMYPQARMAAKEGKLADGEFEQIVKEGIRELLSAEKYETAQAVAKAAGLEDEAKEAERLASNAKEAEGGKIVVPSRRRYEFPESNAEKEGDAGGKGNSGREGNANGDSEARQKTYLAITSIGQCGVSGDGE